MENTTESKANTQLVTDLEERLSNLESKLLTEINKVTLQKPDDQTKD